MRGEAADALGFSGSCRDAQCSRFLAITAAPGVDAAEAVQPYLSENIAFAVPTPPAEVEQLRAVDGLPRVLALILGLIAVLAVTHAAAVTVRRRRGDLAMLRVLGFSGRQLRRVVTVQVAVLALGGAVIGVVLGVALGRLLWTEVADSVPLPAVITFPVAALLLVPLVITVLAQIGASLSRRSAGRVRPALALRAE
jgi:ABC-type lipoprotein release transport system permease subunit